MSDDYFWGSLKWIFYFLGFLMILVFIMISLSISNQNKACKEAGLKYNWNSKCIQEIDGRVLTYNLEVIDWTGLHYKVNRVSGVPT